LIFETEISLVVRGQKA